MHLNPYGQDAVLLAANLANDRPTSLDDLVRRCTSAGLVVDMPVGDRDLTAASQLVDQWCQIVDTPDPVARAELTNRLLAAASAYPRLSNHAGTGWHLHYRDDQASFATVLRAIIAVGTALHLAGRGMGRLGRCAVDGCEAIYADVSRGGRQRYCSPGCANRDAVRRHRASDAGRRPASRTLTVSGQGRSADRDGQRR